MTYTAFAYFLKYLPSNDIYRLYDPKLDNLATVSSYEEAIKRFTRLFGREPKVTKASTPGWWTVK